MHRGDVSIRTLCVLCAVAVALAFGPPALAAHRSISGRVVDESGEPMPRAIISLEPGYVELVTAADGSFTIDYLRDSMGERRKLERRTRYTLEAFRPGFQHVQLEVDYRRKALDLGVITLIAGVPEPPPEPWIDEGGFVSD
jgi:hypothetical protein